jgi:D-sedoheptulose 7-phosphate isomerase
LRRLPAFCLTNDIGFDVVFARQLAALSRPGDIAMGLSTTVGDPLPRIC